MQRERPGFPLIRNSLEITPLPVLIADDITCWENLELCMLKLEDQQFDILWKERKQKLDKLNSKSLSESEKLAKYNRDKISNKIEALPQSVKDDPFILEMEKQLAAGKGQNVSEMLKAFKM
jgi:hypothetical protein